MRLGHPGDEHVQEDDLPPEHRTERALNYLHNLPDKLVNAAAAVLPTPGI